MPAGSLASMVVVNPALFVIKYEFKDGVTPPEPYSSDLYTDFDKSTNYTQGTDPINVQGGKNYLVYSGKHKAAPDYVIEDGMKSFCKDWSPEIMST